MGIEWIPFLLVAVAAIYHLDKLNAPKTEKNVENGRESVFQEVFADEFWNKINNIFGAEIKDFYELAGVLHDYDGPDKEKIAEIRAAMKCIEDIYFRSIPNLGQSKDSFLKGVERRLTEQKNTINYYLDRLS